MPRRQNYFSSDNVSIDLQRLADSDEALLIVDGVAHECSCHLHSYPAVFGYRHLGGHVWLNWPLIEFRSCMLAYVWDGNIGKSGDK